MRCRRTVHLLPLFVGGDLDAARAAAVEDHVATCESCAAELAAFGASRQTLFALKGEPRPSAPDLWPSIRLRLGVPPRVRRWRPVRAAAAVLLAVAGTLALASVLGPSNDEGGSQEGRDPVVQVPVAPEAPDLVRDLAAAAATPGSLQVGPVTPAAPLAAQYLLAEGGLSANEDSVGFGTGDLPSVVPAEPDRTGWDEF